MKMLALCSLALVAAVGFVQPAQSDSAALKQALMDTEVRSHQRWHRGDIAALDALMAQDFRFVVMNGAVEKKEEVVGTADGPPQPGPLRVAALHVEPEEVLLRGNTAVVISLLHLDATVHGRPLPQRMRILSIFTITDDDPEWRLTARSITPILTPPPPQ